MNATSISISVAVLLIGGALFLTTKKPDETVVPVHNVTIVDGVQIVEIKARGGYEPRTSIARAGLPTVLRFDTNGTFDCSSSVSIPRLHISKTLPQTGITDITIGSQEVGTLQGTCGMGMYPFEITFQS